MTKTLQLEFENELGKSYIITLDSPKDDLTTSDVQNAMNEVIDANIIRTSGGSLVGIKGACIISKDIVELILV